MHMTTVPVRATARNAALPDVLLHAIGHVVPLMPFSACRSRGKAVQVHVFEEDSHSLDQPETAFVQWPRILAFFRMHLQDT